MKQTLRKMFLVVEINLILWLAIFGMAFDSYESMRSVTKLALVGLVFAAVAQHWAYYAVYKKAKHIT